MDMGRVPAAELKEAVQTGDVENLPVRLATAVKEAKEVLDTTRDPQLSDIVLDRWCYRDMDDVAEATGSAFLHGYVKAQIDAANLRSLVRTLRMGKNADFLKGVLFEGGDIGVDAILAVSEGGGSGLTELYGSTRFRAAAEAGEEAAKGGSLTAFERACDNAVLLAAGKARSIPFGVEVVLGYLAAKEAEWTAVRIIMSGRMAGMTADAIRERLRDQYV